MKRRNKILAGSSILALLATGGVSLALGLGYSGELFALPPVLSSIGISTIGPILIAGAALFFSLSLVLSISFLRSKQLEKKKSKDQEEKQAKEREKEQEEKQVEKKAKEQEEKQAEKQAKERAEKQAKKQAEKQAKERAEKQAKERAEKQAKKQAEKREKERAEKQAKKQAEKREEREAYTIEEVQRVRELDGHDKGEYFRNAFINFDKRAINLIFSERDLFLKESPTKGYTVLTYYDLVYSADKRDDDKVLKYMVTTLGVDLNEPFRDDLCSPIYYAVKNNMTKVLQRLIDNGADPTKMRHRLEVAIEDTVSIPLIMAARQCQKEQVKLLLKINEVKSNINTADSKGNIALIEVFKKTNKYTSFFLNENSQRQQRFTSERARAREQHDIAKLLLENGADPTIRKNNQTALDLAKENNCDRGIISLLEKAEKKWRKEHKDKESHVEKITKAMQSQVSRK